MRSEKIGEGNGVVVVAVVVVVVGHKVLVVGRTLAAVDARVIPVSDN